MLLFSITVFLFLFCFVDQLRVGFSRSKRIKDEEEHYYDKTQPANFRGVGVVGGGGGVGGRQEGKEGRGEGHSLSPVLLFICPEACCFWFCEASCAEEGASCPNRPLLLSFRLSLVSADKVVAISRLWMEGDAGVLAVDAEDAMCLITLA